MLDEKDIQILKEMFAEQREELRAEMADIRDGLRAETTGMRDGLHAEMADMRDGLRAEMADMRDGLRAEMAVMRDGLRAEMADMRDGLRAEMADMRDGLRAEMADMKVELKEEFRSEFVPQITDEVTRRMSILLDADVNRKLDLILEELAILRETKVSVEDYQKQYDRVDARLSALEAGYRQMSRDMAELKQAN